MPMCTSVFYSVVPSKSSIDANHDSRVIFGDKIHEFYFILLYLNLLNFWPMHSFSSIILFNISKYCPFCTLLLFHSCRVFIINTNWFKELMKRFTWVENNMVRHWLRLVSFSAWNTEWSKAGLFYLGSREIERTFIISLCCGWNLNRPTRTFNLNYGRLRNQCVS